MALIPDEIIDEIRDRVDIVALIEEHVRLKRAGASFKGLCPFHQEKTPSFHVHPVKRSFYCFGCQKHGDAFTFLREMKGLSFIEAAQELARRAGVTIPEREISPEERARSTERSRLYDVNAAAAAYFRDTLLGPKGQPARDYLAKRGIGDDVAAQFQLGYAVDEWDGLIARLSQRRLPLEAAAHLGLVAPRRTGHGFYDVFRHRVICPVIVREGEIAGFSGRTLSADDPRKYYNSPESTIYKKSHLLYGLHAARAAFHRKGRAILVEGNFDVVSLHQAGFTETVAPLGTALTEHQVERLRRLVGTFTTGAVTVYLCLDGDKAGRAASMRAVREIPLLVAGGFEVRIVSLPDGDDPDSFVRRHGAAALETLLERARTVVDHYCNEVWFRTDQSADRLTIMLKEIAPLLGHVTDPDRRAIMIGQFSRAMNVAPALIERAVRGARAIGSSPESVQRTSKNPSEPHFSAAPPPTAEVKVLAILADHPSLFPDAERLHVRSLLTDARLRDMYSAAHAGRDLLLESPPDLGDLVARRVLAGEYRDLPKPRETLIETVRNLRRVRLEAQARDLDRQVKQANQRGDLVLARELTMRKLNLLKDAANTQPEEESR